MILALSVTLLAQSPVPPPSPPPPGESHWTRAAPLPEPLLDIHAAVLDAKIYVAGGIDATGQPSAHVYRYDPATNAWQRLADLPAPRHNMPLAVLNDTIYAVGGLSGTTFKPERNMWLYRSGANTWDTRASLPAPRGASAVAPIGKKLVVMGGIRRFVDGGEASAPVIYDPAFDSWLEVWPMPTPRDHLVAEALHGLVYVIGGRLLTPAHNYDVNEIYDPSKYLGGRWLRKAPMPTARGALGSAVIDGKIHVVGGESSQAVYGAHEVYDPDKDTWVEAAPLPTPRHGIAVASVGGKLYVIGGAATAGLAASDLVEVFTP